MLKLLRHAHEVAYPHLEVSCQVRLDFETPHESLNINYLTVSHIRPPVDNQGSPNTPKVWGPFFWKKKRTPAATYPQVEGFQILVPNYLGVQTHNPEMSGLENAM